MSADEMDYADPATVTVITGKPAIDEIAVAFGADPGKLVHVEDLPVLFTGDVLMLHPVGDAILAVEPNGVQGSRSAVLERLTVSGRRAASWYWNVNGLTQLSVARDGVILAAFEPGYEPPPDDPEVTALLAGYDDPGDARQKHQMAVRVIERFTGVALQPEDLTRVREIGSAYRIVPHLDELTRVPRSPSGESGWFTDIGPLGAESHLLARLSDHQARDLAWWIATEVAARVGASGDPAVAAALRNRELTEQAQWLARTGQLSEGNKTLVGYVWGTIHEATNPDPLAALCGNLVRARWFVTLEPNTATDTILERAAQQVRALTAPD